MPRVHFRSKSFSFELSGDEAFISRQLESLRLAKANVPKREQDASPEPVAPQSRSSAFLDVSGVVRFLERGPELSTENRRQDAALRFAYFVSKELGRPTVTTGDMLRCGVEAGVDSRNFRAAVEALVAKGMLAEGEGGFVLTAEGEEAVAQLLI